MRDARSSRRYALCVAASMLLLWTLPAWAGDGGSAGLLEQLGETVAEWVDGLLHLFEDEGPVNSMGFEIEPNG